MPRISRRLGTTLACAALLLAAGCAGVSDPNAAAPDAPDLYQALPEPANPPELPPTTAPPVPATPTTERSTPTSTPKPRPQNGAARHAAAAGPAQAAPGPGAGPGGGTVAWAPAGGDEFNGPALDEGQWNTYNSEGAFGTGFRRPEAISQSNGLLRITARGDVSGGMGMRVGQTYGRWEFRARTDKGRGFGSAILLWPDSNNFPEEGELDIMEVPNENRDLAHFVVHWGAENNVHGADVAGDFSQWHTFALEWLPDRITWFVDGVKKYENTDPVVIPTKPMHMTIQLDQGPFENWIPARDETTPEELSLEVDWVRIFNRP